MTSAGSLLQAPRLPRLSHSSPPPSVPQPPPPCHVFLPISHQDLAEWTAQPQASGAAREAQLLLNRVVGIVQEGPCDSLGMLVGGGKPVWVSRAMAGETSGGVLQMRESVQVERRGDGGGAGARGWGDVVREYGSEGRSGEGRGGSGLGGGEGGARQGRFQAQRHQEQEMVRVEGHDVEEGVGAAAVRTTFRALRTTLRQKYASSVQLHVYGG